MRSWGRLNTNIKFRWGRHGLLIVFFLFPCFDSKGQQNYPCGARSAAMGHASVCLDDIWATFNNQACLAGYNKSAASLYFENRFFIKELSLKTFALSIPVNKGTLGFSISSFGYQLYQENKIGLAYAMKFSNNSDAGIQLDILEMKIGDIYGKKYCATFEAGFKLELNSNLCLAAHIFNPLRSTLDKSGLERWNMIFRLGSRYKFSKKTILCLEISKNLYNKPVFRSGIEYSLLQHTYIRAGLSSNPLMPAFGFGLGFNRFRLDISSSMHQVLGFSTQCALVYIFHE